MDTVVIVVSEESGEYLVDDEFVVNVVHDSYVITDRLLIGLLFLFRLLKLPFSFNRWVLASFAVS